MKFERGIDDLDNCILQRYVCTEHGVEVGIYPVIFGFRIRAGQIGGIWCPVDFCAGAVQEDVEALFGMVLKVLQNQEEPDWSAFPLQKIKPVMNDVECFAELKKMSAGFVPVELPALDALKVAAFEALRKRRL